MTSTRQATKRELTERLDGSCRRLVDHAVAIQALKTEPLHLYYLRLAELYAGGQECHELEATYAELDQIIGERATLRIDGWLSLDAHRGPNGGLAYGYRPVHKQLFDGLLLHAFGCHRSVSLREFRSRAVVDGVAIPDYHHIELSLDEPALCAFDASELS
jgi:hypothetical protein